jgi:hypothetical protein
MAANPAVAGTATERPLRFTTGVDVASRRTITVEDNQSQFSRRDYDVYTGFLHGIEVHLSYPNLRIFSPTCHIHSIPALSRSPILLFKSRIYQTCLQQRHVTAAPSGSPSPSKVKTSSTRSVHPFPPLLSPHILDTPVQFICHCTDDRKITSSMFALNFIVKSDTLKYVHGVKQQEGNHYC